MHNEDYSDIIDTPYPQKKWNIHLKYPPMNIQDRAKIFNAFAALRGHSAALKNKAEELLDTKKEELLEDSKSELNKVLLEINEKFNLSIPVNVRATYFSKNKNSLKSTGIYKKIEGPLTKLSLNENALYINQTKIPFKNLHSLAIVP